MMYITKVNIFVDVIDEAFFVNKRFVVIIKIEEINFRDVSFVVDIDIVVVHVVCFVRFLKF